LSEHTNMTGEDFIRRVKALAKERGVEVRIDQKRGRGSHVTLYFGDRFAVIPHPQRDLKTGTQAAILKQLGIRKEDLK